MISITNNIAIFCCISALFGPIFCRIDQLQYPHGYKSPLDGGELDDWMAYGSDDDWMGPYGSDGKQFTSGSGNWQQPQQQQNLITDDASMLEQKSFIEEIIDYNETGRVSEILECLIPEQKRMKLLQQKQRIRYRDEDDQINPMVKLFKDLGQCPCEATSYSMQVGIITSKLLGVSTIGPMCNKIGEAAPITREECAAFNYNMFDSVINMSMELTSKDVVCNLLSGKCVDAQSQSKTEPFACEFCDILHKKAHRITKNFANLFKSFDLMCNRLQGQEKAACLKHVQHMTNKLDELMDTYFTQHFIEVSCTHNFKCKAISTTPAPIVRG